MEISATGEVRAKPSATWAAPAFRGARRRAMGFYERALAINGEIGDRRGEGNVRWNMSLALDKLGQRKEAIEHAEAALKIAEQIEDPCAAMVRRQLEEWKK
jgi:tetratricopeptide (TPR) repeat protein